MRLSLERTGGRSLDLDLHLEQRGGRLTLSLDHSLRKHRAGAGSRERRGLGERKNRQQRRAPNRGRHDGRHQKAHGGGRGRSAARRRALRATSWALRQVGTRESEPEVARWSRHAGYSGVPAWCRVFVHEAWRRAGVDLDNGVGWTNNIRAWADAETHRLRAIPLRKARRGDLVLMDWPGVGDADDHVAILRRRCRPGRPVLAVSGNSSDRVERNVYPRSQVAQAVRVI